MTIKHVSLGAAEFQISAKLNVVIDALNAAPNAGSSQIAGSAITANAKLGATNLPANAFILGVLFRETAGHAVSISLGSTSGASDVLAAVSVAASSGLYVGGVSFAASWFSAGSPQAIFVTSASWGGASINAALLYLVGP